MEEFFRAMSGQFAQQRSREGRAALILAVAFALLVLAVTAVWLARRLRARRLLRAFAKERGLGPAAVKLATRLARGEKLAPMAWLEQLDRFEVATRKALEAEGGAAEAASIGKLRRALGYDRVPDYMPLYSSRELAAGMPVQIGRHRGRVVESDEQALALELEGPAPCAPGEVALLELHEVREAPYRLHCRLISAIAISPEKSRLTFAHDETPLRLEGSDARRPARGAVVLRSALADGPTPEPEQTAALVEASPHQLLVEAPLQLAIGRQLECSFGLSGETFRRLRAVVQSSVKSEAGHRATLELRGLSAADRKRLLSAIGGQR